MNWQGRNFSFLLGKKTYLMGILNVTPDSFSDGGKYNELDAAILHAVEMEQQGADLIDLGAQSTRPGHTPVSAQEELSRLVPVLKALQGKVTVPISVDTFYPQAAQEALELGAAIVNDVSGTVKKEMADVVRRTGAGWVIMHTGGGTADQMAEVSGDIVDEVKKFFNESLRKVEEWGVTAGQVCLDMGLGFGKTYEQNLRLIRRHREIKPNRCAMLTGVSRKRVIGRGTGEENVQQREFGNVAAHTAAIAGGTDFLRVHDVAACVQGARMADAIYRTEGI